MEGGTEMTKGPIFNDIRRYYCEYCGICRSKKTLISSHILSHHQDEVNKRKADDNAEKEELKSNTCEECSLSFQKPAHLKQHMQSHLLERPFMCSEDDCNSSYRRKDHLNRHLLQHQGKLFECSSTGCSSRFSIQSNMKRHVKEFHDESSPVEVDAQKEYICPEPGCGKVFKYASKLRKHEDSHGNRFICHEDSYVMKIQNEEQAQEKPQEETLPKELQQTVEKEQEHEEREIEEETSERVDGLADMEIKKDHLSFLKVMPRRNKPFVRGEDTDEWDKSGKDYVKFQEQLRGPVGNTAVFMPAPGLPPFRPPRFTTLGTPPASTPPAHTEKNEELTSQ